MSQWIDALTACRVLLGDPTKEELQSISYDPRKAKAGDLFLCLKGTKLDSHDKILELIASGVRIFVVEKELEELDLANVERDKLCMVKVENGRKALAELSAFYFHSVKRDADDRNHRDEGKNHHCKHGAEHFGRRRISHRAYWNNRN